MPVSSGGGVVASGDVVESGDMVESGGSDSEGAGAGAGSVGMVDGAESAGGAVISALSSFLAHPAASSTLVAATANKA